MADGAAASISEPASSIQHLVRIVLRTPGMTANLDFCPCHAVPKQGIQYAQ
jgi:hypothetical protein